MSVSVAENVTGSSPNYTVTPSPTEPVGGYTPPPALVTFTNNSTDEIIVYYQNGVAFTQQQDIPNTAGQNSGAVITVSAGVNLTYNVVKKGTPNPGGWAHVIHVGS